MGRADVLLAAAVGAFALFVGVQVAGRARHRAPAASVQLAGAPTTTAPAPRDEPDGRADTRATIAHSSMPAPERDSADIRARIADAGGTYMTEMLGDLQGTLVRWPDRRERGLRVWVQSMTSVRDWDLRYAQMARDAFADWDRGGLPMRLDFVLDSASSDVHIVWIDRFAPEMGQRIGATSRTTDQHGWIVAADISVAVHDSAGRTIPPASLAGIVRHEAGHAIGLGHSRDPSTKMYPLEMTSDIAAADRATLRLLYQLPPGPVR